MPSFHNVHLYKFLIAGTNWGQSDNTTIGTMVELPAPKNEISNQVQSVPEEEVREGGYGWVCVVCTLLINAHTWGINAVCTP
jgi:hypothetical protein